MIAPPEFTSRRAVEYFIAASKAATGIVPSELTSMSPEAATRWLALRWDLYYVPAHHEKILTEFMIRILTK